MLRQLLLAKQASPIINSIPNSTLIIGSIFTSVLILNYMSRWAYTFRSNKQQQHQLEQQKKSNHKKKQQHGHQEYYILPSDVKVYVINTIQECDSLLTPLYKFILETIKEEEEMIKQQKNIEMMTGDPLTMITPDQCQLLQQQQQQQTFNTEAKDVEPNYRYLNRVIGFDAEWSSSSLLDDDLQLKQQMESMSSTQQKQILKSSEKVAIIQLSTKDQVFVIQVSQMERIPESLSLLLSDPNIIKVGVSISQDANIIFKNFGIIVKGCCDLVPLARMTKYEGNGLAALAMSVMGANMNKSHHIRCSHWENLNLTIDQIHYAALDAWIGREIFDRMFKTHLSFAPFDNAMDFCRNFINTTFKIKESKSNKQNNNNNNNNNGSTKPPKKSKTIFVPEYRTLYDNCLMFGPDDELLANISKSKVQWYVSRNLAVITNDNPLSIKLTFRPKGNGHANDSFYLANKENICVVCGTNKKILRHSIVPHCYRQHLPIEIKSHSSHDIVILCENCSLSMSKRLHLMKLMIAKQYQVPYDSNNQAYDIDRTLLKMAKQAEVVYSHLYQSNGEKLKKRIAQIPPTKLEEFKLEIMEYLGKDQLDQDDLKQLMKSNPKNKKLDYISHERLVMDKVLSEGDEGIKKFICQWRLNFVETAQPKYLNEFWSVSR